MTTATDQIDVKLTRVGPHRSQGWTVFLGDEAIAFYDRDPMQFSQRFHVVVLAQGEKHGYHSVDTEDPLIEFLCQQRMIEATKIRSDNELAEQWSDYVSAKWERKQSMNTKNALENAIAHARTIRDKTCDDCAVHDHDDQLQADCVTLAIEIERLQDLQRIVDDLTDPAPCSFDHHGYCQAHGYFETEPKCPQARAKELNAKTT